MINLNDASLAASEGKAIFNDGRAGIVENVTLGISKKKPEDKEGSPDYKLTFTDQNGGACNTSFWYVETATEYATVDEQTQKQGKALKHVIHAIYGNTFQFPSFNSAREMLELEYVKNKYDGKYWNTLPKEMARFWKEISTGA